MEFQESIKKMGTSWNSLISISGGYWKEKCSKRGNSNLFIYVRFFVTHFLWRKKWFKTAVFFKHNFFQKLSCEWKPYTMANTVLFSFEIKENYCWNCCLGPSNRPKQQINLYLTCWQYPLINYLLRCTKIKIRIHEQIGSNVNSKPRIRAEALWYQTAEQKCILQLT